MKPSNGLSVTKESNKRSAFWYAVSQPSFFLPLEGSKKKLRVETALVSLCYRQCPNGSGTALENRTTLSVNRTFDITDSLFSFVPDGVTDRLSYSISLLVVGK